jgi:hypothetical protein
MITALNAHGIVLGWSQKKATQKYIKPKINMETDDKNLAQLKNDYLDLVLKISKFRNEGKEPPFELIIQAQKIGRLAHISESQ